MTKDLKFNGEIFTNAIIDKQQLKIIKWRKLHHIRGLEGQDPSRIKKTGNLHILNV